MQDEVLLTQKLIQKKSVTPNDEGCQQLLLEQLAQLGFESQFFNKEGVTNLFVYHTANSKKIQKPFLCFAGHTDVVPTGDLNLWKYDPFSATIENEILYGRGAADMKSSIACMFVSAREFVQKHPDHEGTLGFVITSDEEGEATYGTQYALSELSKQGVEFEYVIIGEPSSTNKVGDVIKVGRRGSINFELTVEGKQGHIAYPHLANNPIHSALPLINNIVNIKWDEGNEFFEPSSLQVSNINSGTGATNVIPNEIKIIFNIRFSNEITSDEIVQRINEVLKTSDAKTQLKYKISGQPYMSNSHQLKSAVISAIQHKVGFEPEQTTFGGISDGRFFSQYTQEVIECGLVNESIHKIDENTQVQDICILKNIYLKIMQNMLTH